MPKLAEIQTRFRGVIVQRDLDIAASLRPLLAGGHDPQRRLAIHQRNYQQSLTEALLVKFPATGWLMGTSFLIEAAERFVCDHPPAAPCIAEYGAEFPAFLARSPRTEPAPYLKDFAELEWCIGEVAIAVDHPPLEAQAFSGIHSDALPNLFLSLQPGLRFLRLGWPVDELMALYLSDTAPERMDLSPADTWIEVRGARGNFHMTRLDPAEFIFRKSIAEGRSIGDAADSALDFHAAFDPGTALAALISSGLVIGLAAHSVTEHL
jgi:Putative DNA-binding domain